MNRKIGVSTIVILITLIIGVAIALKPSASLTLKNATVAGYTFTQIVIEDWTFTRQQVDSHGMAHTDAGDFDGDFTIAQTVPPNYALLAFPSSFMYHHILISSAISPEEQELIRSGKVSFTYYINGVPHDIKFK